VVLVSLGPKKSASHKSRPWSWLKKVNGRKNVRATAGDLSQRRRAAHWTWGGTEQAGDGKKSRWGREEFRFVDLKGPRRIKNEILGGREGLGGSWHPREGGFHEFPYIKKRSGLVKSKREGLREKY